MIIYSFLKNLMPVEQDILILSATDVSIIMFL